MKLRPSRANSRASTVLMIVILVLRIISKRCCELNQVTSGIQPSMVISAFPGMTVPLQVVQENVAGPKMKAPEEDTSEDDEEEIDDDEDGIDAGPPPESALAAATV